MDWDEAEYWSKDFKGELFVDVGANIGRYTIRHARNFTSVIALEPWKATFNDLQRNVREAKLMNVELLMVGASDTSFAPMMWSYRCGESNSVVRKHPVSGERAYRCEQVVMRRVDDIIGERKLSFLKIDTEGHDVAALRGAMGVVKRDRPHVQVEWHRKEDAQTLDDMLRECGLETRRVHTNDTGGRAGWVLAAPVKL